MIDHRSGDGSGDREELAFVSLVHVKRSFTEVPFEEPGFDVETDGVYPDEYGHAQSADQVIARGRVTDGDPVSFLAAGTGDTWGATGLEWCG